MFEETGSAYGLRGMNGKTRGYFLSCTGQDLNARHFGYPMTGTVCMNDESICQDESIARLTQHPCRGPPSVNL